MGMIVDLNRISDMKAVGDVGRAGSVERERDKVINMKNKIMIVIVSKREEMIRAEIIMKRILI